METVKSRSIVGPYLFRVQSLGLRRRAHPRPAMEGLYLMKDKSLVVRAGTPDSDQLGDIEVNVKVLGVGLSPSGSFFL